MDKLFWHERWRRNEIGFHRHSVHPALERHRSRFSAQTDPGEPVLVPLCGKSLDMHWLAAQGHPVVGVELDRGAIEAFFDEAGLEPAVDDAGALVSRSAGGITLIEGDFFEFACASGFRLVYDRAALIALPPDIRPRYLDHLAALLAPGASGLLITLEYPPDCMQGPPFAVLPAELHAHPRFDFERIQRTDVLAAHPRFAHQGLPWLKETVYSLAARH